MRKKFTETDGFSAISINNTREPRTKKTDDGKEFLGKFFCVYCGLKFKKNVVGKTSKGAISAKRRKKLSLLEKLVSAISLSNWIDDFSSKIKKQAILYIYQKS